MVPQLVDAVTSERCSKIILCSLEDAKPIVSKISQLTADCLHRVQPVVFQASARATRRPPAQLSQSHSDGKPAL